MANMGGEDKVETLLLLIQNVDVFAWSPNEVPGVDLEFIVHRLNVDPSFPPKKQKSRRSEREHIEAVRSKVQKLKEAGAIKEIYLPEWLANTVVVKKKNGMMSFLDAFQGYHQIALAPEDREKTAFRMPTTTTL